MLFQFAMKYRYKTFKFPKEHQKKGSPFGKELENTDISFYCLPIHHQSIHLTILYNHVIHISLTQNNQPAAILPIYETKKNAEH